MRSRSTKSGRPTAVCEPDTATYYADPLLPLPDLSIRVPTIRPAAPPTSVPTANFTKVADLKTVTQSLERMSLLKSASQNNLQPISSIASNMKPRTVMKPTAPPTRASTAGKLTALFRGEAWSGVFV